MHTGSDTSINNKAYDRGMIGLPIISVWKSCVLLQADDHAEQRLATLVQMFNVADDSQSQFKILLDAIAFAKASGQSTLLAPAIRVSRASEEFAHTGKGWKLKMLSIRPALLFQSNY